LNHPLAIGFPENCFVSHVRDASIDSLFEEEKQIVTRYARMPLKHFCMGRLASHQCLKIMKLDQPILRSQHREPLWPEQVVGSITHSGDLAIAATAYKRDYIGLGLDCERIDRKIKPDIGRRFATLKEQDWVYSDNDLNKINVRLLQLLSAKEAVFKAFFPIEKIFLSLLDAEINFDKDQISGNLLKKPTKLWDLDKVFHLNQISWEDYLISSLYLPR